MTMDMEVSTQQVDDDGRDFWKELSAERELFTFPGPGLIQQNDQFGTYVVASRRLHPGEEIIEENPLMIAPRIDWNYDPNNPYEDKICMGCYKKCSYNRKCSKCGWPVCEILCENAYIHSNYECKIFRSNQLNWTNLPFDYPAVETLRCLLLREKDPIKWMKLMKHESHVADRRKDDKTKECRSYVINFIQNDCKFQDFYSIDLIEHVMGIISINTFCMINDYHRHASLIFHSSSYVTHNCDPNMDVIWKFHPDDSSSYNQNYFSVKFFAAKVIEAGELLTHSYMFNWNPVIERQNYLANHWYFHCECSKCRLDLLNELLNLNEWDFFEMDDQNDQNNNAIMDNNNNSNNNNDKLEQLQQQREEKQQEINIAEGY